MPSQTRRAIAPFLGIETLDPPFPRIQIQKAHVNPWGCCNGLFSNEDEVVRFSELHPPATPITNNNNKPRFILAKLIEMKRTLSRWSKNSFRHVLQCANVFSTIIIQVSFELFRFKLYFCSLSKFCLYNHFVWLLRDLVRSLYRSWWPSTVLDCVWF